MKIAIFGANGTIGQRILKEALNRGHFVSAIVRDKSKITLTNENLTVVEGNVIEAESVASAVAGSDAVVSAVGPSENNPGMVIQTAKSLLEGLAKTEVKRLLIVGGAGSLEVAPNMRLVDAPDFPEAWKPIALAACEALEVYKSTPTEIDWVYVSPAALIQPGERTGNFRVGGDQLLVDENGESKISAEDFAVAIVDEIEHPQFKQQRITIAY